MQPTSKPREGVFLRHNGKIVERRDQEVSILIKTRCPEKWVMVDTETGEMWRFEDGVGFSRISLLVVGIKKHNEISAVEVEWHHNPLRKNRLMAPALARVGAARIPDRRRAPR